MIDRISHPSENYIKNPNINEFKIFLDEKSKAELIKEAEICKNKFGPLGNVANKFPPEKIKNIFMLRKNIYLNNFISKISDILCNKYGIVILEGFPIGLDNEILEIAYFIFGCYLGIPMHNNKNKIFIWNVMAKQYEANISSFDNIRYGNTGEPLDFHTDTGTFAGLLCINQANSGGENYFISTVSVHNKLFKEKRELLEILYSDFYVDRRGEQLDGDTPYAKLPIFKVSKSGHLMTHWAKRYTYSAYEKYSVPELSEIQKEALQVLSEFIEDISKTEKIVIKSKPGDLLLMNNNLIFHNRTSYTGVRLLKRLWVLSNEYPSFPHMFGYWNK